jgi:hypothetical protein
MIRQGLAPWRIKFAISEAQKPDEGSGTISIYAAALEEVGTEEIVFRICDAIW